MRGVGRDEGAGEELRTEEGEVVFDGEDLGFCVKMVGIRHLHTAGGYSKGAVLKGLKLLDIGGGGVGEPYGGSICE